MIKVHLTDDTSLSVQVLTNEYEDRYVPIKPTAVHPEETESFTNISPTKKVKGKHNKHDKKKKKNDKAVKKAERRGKATKDGKVGGKKNGKKLVRYPETDDYPRSTEEADAPSEGIPGLLPGLLREQEASAGEGGT